MFKFFFIIRHKRNCLNYVYYNLQTGNRRPTEPADNIRYSLPIDIHPAAEEDEVDEIKIPKPTPSKRVPPTPPASSKSPDILHSDRDSYDYTSVAFAMRSYLRDMPPQRDIKDISNQTFVEKLLQHIRNKRLVEADVYKAALMDRRLFSKIISDVNYRPSKDTVLALVFALRLSYSEAKDLLERAGYTLSHSLRRDIMIEYFIKERVYNLDNINAFLYNMNEKIIGRSM